MRTSALFGAKHIGFLQVYGVFARIRGGREEVEPVRTEGVRFCADVLYGRPQIKITCNNTYRVPPKKTEPLFRNFGSYNSSSVCITLIKFDMVYFQINIFAVCCYIFMQNR